MSDDNISEENTSPDGKKTWKTISTLPTTKVDYDLLKNMSTKKRVTYLAIPGWKIVIEIRSSNEYIYAVKYFERKKKRFYLGKREDSLDILKSKDTIQTDIEALKQLVALNFNEQVYYLAIRGWKIEIEVQNEIEYIHAVRFINKKKKKINLGKREDRTDLEKIE